MSLSQGSFLSPNKSQIAREWSEKFQDAGCSEDAIETLLQSEITLDMKKLYQSFLQVLPEFRHDLTLFEMYCLSGNQEAFDFVLSKCEAEFNEHYSKIDQKIFALEIEKNQLKSKLAFQLKAIEKQRLNKIDEELEALNKQYFLPYTSILFYSAMSGDANQLDRALQLMKKYSPDLWKDKIYQGMNILHAAILSGNVQQVKKVLALSETNDVDFKRRITHEGYYVSPFHLSALSGSEEIVNLMAEDVDIFEKDRSDLQTDNPSYTAIDYAIIKGDTQIENLLLKKGLTPAENYGEFHFFGYEVQVEFRLENKFN